MGKKYWRAMATAKGAFVRDEREAYEVGHGEILAYRVKVEKRGFFRPREQCTYTVIARDPIKPDTQVRVWGNRREEANGQCKVVTPGMASYDYYIYGGVENFAAEIRTQITEMANE